MNTTVETTKLEGAVTELIDLWNALGDLEHEINFGPEIETDEHQAAFTAVQDTLALVKVALHTLEPAIEWYLGPDYEY